MMVTKDDLRDKLSFRLVGIGDEVSQQQVAVYISEILGDSTNALYKLLSFSSKECLLDYLVHCDFMTSKYAMKTKALRKYLLQKPKVQYHKPGLSQENLHVLLLYTSTGYSGLIQKQIKWSRHAKPPLTSNDGWHKLIKDFENKKTEASNTPATGPIAPGNLSMSLQTPKRRATASP
jgi:hypothetical protein